MKLLTISFALFIPFAAAQAICKGRNGLPGVCISTSACSGGRGTSEPGLCPGPSNIQCCTYGTCTLNGIPGRCITTSACSGFGGTSIPNLCPGPNNIQCCKSKGGSGGSGPIPGLNAKQAAHARTIGQVAHSTGVLRGCLVAMVTALTESNIIVYASSRIPESLKYYHEAVGSDHYSVGIFQQQASPWGSWGTVQSCMDPAQSAGKFFAALMKIRNWQNLSVGDAAQKVQRSNHSDRYEMRLGQAQMICSVVY